MNDDPDLDGLIQVRLMNEYGMGLPLWTDFFSDVDADDLDLSESLRSDLMAFAARWDAAVPAEVYDDRWTGVPVMQSLVQGKYAIDRLLHPERQRAATAEAEEMRPIGENLAARVQQELGPAYRVTYVH